MPNQWPMPCRFNPDHGTFPNPPVISRHYAAEHAHEWHPSRPERIDCPVCQQSILRSGLTRHLKTTHPSYRNGAALPVVARKQPAPVKAAPPAPPDLPPLGPDDVDQIVLGMVDQLAGPAGLFPVQYLPALFAWREATAVFLRAVQS